MDRLTHSTNGSLLESSSGFTDPDEAAGLRRMADSLIENISALRFAITRIETLEGQIAGVKKTLEDCRPHMVAAGLQADLIRLDHALDSQHREG